MNIHEQKLRELYIEQEKSSREIAKIYHSHKDTILSLLREKNIPVRPSSHDKYGEKEKEQVINLYKKGYGACRIENRTSVSTSTVHRWLQEEGIETREWQKDTARPFYPSFNESLGFVIGAVKGDGSIVHSERKKDGKKYAQNQIQLSVTDKEFAEKFADSLSEALGKTKKYKPHKIELEVLRNAGDNLAKKAKWCVRGYGNKFVEWYDSLSEEELRGKLIEHKEFAKGFLRGMFDSEGNVVEVKDRKPYGIYKYKRIIVSSTNKRLLELCSDVIETHFEIKANVYRKETRSTNLTDLKVTIYVLAIQAQQSVSNFAKEIGFSIRRKQKVIE